MDELICCFSGHRSIPEDKRESVMEALRTAIFDAYRFGYRTFVSGGAKGFDLMAAEAVINLRQAHDDVRLKMYLPYNGQSEQWKADERILYDQILFNADEVRYISEEYTPDCLFRRNRAMVDDSTLLICYLNKNSGGTLYTVNYAKKKQIEIINLG